MFDDIHLEIEKVELWIKEYRSNGGTDTMYLEGKLAGLNTALEFMRNEYLYGDYERCDGCCE